MKDLFCDSLPPCDVTALKAVKSYDGDYWHVIVNSKEENQLKIKLVDKKIKYVEITSKEEFDKLPARYKTEEGKPKHVFGGSLNFEATEELENP